MMKKAAKSGRICTSDANTAHNGRNVHNFNFHDSSVQDVNLNFSKGSLFAFSARLGRERLWFSLRESELGIVSFLVWKVKMGIRVFIDITKVFS